MNQQQPGFLGRTIHKTELKLVEKFGIDRVAGVERTTTHIAALLAGAIMAGKSMNYMGRTEFDPNPNHKAGALAMAGLLVGMTTAIVANESMQSRAEPSYFTDRLQNLQDEANGLPPSRVPSEPVHINTAWGA